MTLRYLLVIGALASMVPLACRAIEPVTNDTGLLACFDAVGDIGTVSPGTPDPEDPAFDEQDCTRGASAADALGVQYKIGTADTPGRDYTKIGNDGSVLAAGAVLGTAPGNWGCTRDNVTGLTWEIRTDDNGLRDKDHKYTYFNPDGSDANGTRGVVGTDTCNGTLPLGQCNISAYRDAVNALTGGSRLCGQTDWRVPTPKELQSLVDYGLSDPALDVTWFPNVVNITSGFVGINYLTSAPAPAYIDQSWIVEFGGGDLGVLGFVELSVLLVRGGP